jgi:hypothetical protein
MITGLTTLGLIFLPRLLPATPDLISRAELASNGVYQLRLWIGVIHPLLAVTGILGVTFVVWDRSPGVSATAFLLLLLWGICEVVQQALLLVGLTWRLYPLYLSAADSALRAPIAASIDAVLAVSDALFFVILLAFIAGHVLFAWLLRREPGLGRLVAVAFALAAGLGVLSFATRFGGGVVPGGTMDLLYPLIQPAARVVIGVWLWRSAVEGLPRPVTG